MMGHQGRLLARSGHEEARDEARAIANTPAHKRSRRERKKVEMPFAHLKRILKLDSLQPDARYSLVQNVQDLYTVNRHPVCLLLCREGSRWRD